MKPFAMLAVATLVSLSTWPAAGEEARQGIEKFRFNEDYGFLRSTNLPADPFDPVKYIPLDDAGDKYFSIGGAARQRYEYTSKPLFGDDPQDDDGVWLQRYRLHGDLRLGRQLRLFGELSSGLAQGRAGGPSPVDENELAVQNAFADVSIRLDGGSTVTLRGGRQELEFGSGRLVDVRDGTNVRRTFDAVRGFVTWSGWEVSPVAARPRVDRQGTFDDETSDDEALWGAYATGQPGLLPKGQIDLYYLGFRDDLGSFVQGAEDETRHTVGTRLWGGAGGWDWNWEAAYQFGSFGGGDIRAWTVASDSGFTFNEAPLRPRLGLRANIASGDDDPDDSDLQTFNPLFPRGNYFSQAAVLGPRNFFNVNPHLTLQLADDLSVNTDANFYWRLETEDGVYSPSGQILREPGGSDARYVATGISIEAVWEPLRNIDFTAIYTRLEPGAFVRDTGDSESIDFVELTARFRF